ncbi:MAG: DUF3276 family protein [Chitinophagales bacterium]|nr:DUF3276 family protein [Chitinophagales bacterium]
MEHDDNRKKSPAVYSKTIRAGRRRTYFFDVRTTKSNDYYITLTESKKKFNDDGYDRHKIFLYKEDFNKFMEALTNTINHVKQDLLPEYDFDEFSKEYDDEDDEYRDDYEERDEFRPTEHKPVAEKPVEVKEEAPKVAPAPSPSISDDFSEEDLKW